MAEKIRHNIVLKEFKIEYVLNNFAKKGIRNHEKSVKVEVNGKEYLVYLSSQRYVLFKSKGLRCVKCGKKAKKCYLVTNEDNPKRAHFEFMIDDNTMLTKDHIIPKSKGGKNSISNYQPMCNKCNLEKADKIEKTKKQSKFYFINHWKNKIFDFGFDIYFSKQHSEISISLFYFDIGIKF